MRAVIHPGVLRGAVDAPPSKSEGHRLLLCAALAEGESRVRGVPESEDLAATLDCLRVLGASAEREGDAVTVRGCGGRVRPGGTYPCRESGSTLRFFLPAALLAGGEARFTGAPRLLDRGVSVYEDLLSPRGVRIARAPGYISVCGRLAPGGYALPGDVSSQFVTGLLFALPLLSGESVLRVTPPVESGGYVRLTEAAQARFGVRAEAIGDYEWRIPGGARYAPADVSAGGDWSNAAALLAFNALGGAVSVRGLDARSPQGDRVFPELLARLSGPSPEADLSACPDLAPVLIAAAAALHGGRFTGTRRLRLKESDRGAAMAEELCKFGVRAEVRENEIVVPDAPLVPPRDALSSHNDHRVVMALALLCSRTGGTIDGAEAVRKSWPGFFDALAALGMEAELYAG